MRIYTKTQGFDLTPAIDTHVNKQLYRNLASSERHVIAVDVFLTDINGPKGGIDKKAVVCVQLASRMTIRFEAVHSDLYAAVSLAARRTKHTVRRALRRLQRMEKAELRGLRQFAGEFQTG